MITSPTYRLAACFALLAASTACMHRQGGSNNPTAGGAVSSPFEKAVMYNTVLAQTNDTVIHGVIAIAKLTPSPVSKQDAARILITQRNIAAAHQKLENILALGPAAAAGHAAEIKAIADQVGELTKATLAIAPLADVKDPNGGAGLIAEIQSISTLVDIVVTDLEAAGILKTETGVIKQ